MGSFFTRSMFFLRWSIDIILNLQLWLMSFVIVRRRFFLFSVWRTSDLHTHSCAFYCVVTAIPNPCLTGAHYCGANAVCTAIGKLSYHCKCQPSFCSNGTTCVREGTYRAFCLNFAHHCFIAMGRKLRLEPGAPLPLSYASLPFPFHFPSTFRLQFKTHCSPLPYVELRMFSLDILRAKCFPDYPPKNLGQTNL